VRIAPLPEGGQELRTLAACLPSAVRVDFGRCAIVRFLLAARAAFLMFRFAARLCFIVAMAVSLSLVSAGHFTLTSARGRDNTSNLYLVFGELHGIGAFGRRSRSAISMPVSSAGRRLSDGPVHGGYTS
jgi:hypothetical protein